MERPLGAQISHMLKDRGVEVIFGIPGVHNQEMYRGIEEAGLTHILARHEQGAGFMADGYARATGRPGVCYVITGPGLCNTMTPMGQAYSDSVPMLVISSCLDETAATRGQLHQMKDQRGAAEAVCDWSEEARTAEAAYELIERALMEFETSRKRPKHLQVPIRALEATAAPAPANYRDIWKDPTPVPPDQFKITPLNTVQSPVPKVANSLGLPVALMRAERPLFVLGGGAAHLRGRGNPARKVFETCKAATICTYAGRGIADPDAPLNFGASLARSGSAAVLDAADLAVIVGTDLAEVDLWRPKAGHRPGAYLVNTDPEVLARGYPEDRRIQNDALDFFADLADALEGEPASGWSPEIVSGYRTRWRAEVDADYPGVLPVMDALRDALPGGTMIYSDMTQFAYAAKEVWDMDRPGHWHHPSGFGTLGYALPAAIGGQIGRPGKPTLAIAGDYGFQYTLQELATAVELQLPLPIFLWDNGKLGAIESSMIAAQIAPNAVIAQNPDFVKLAQAYGALATRPSNLDAMQDAVRTAFDADRPALIHVTPDIA